MSIVLRVLLCSALMVLSIQTAVADIHIFDTAIDWVAVNGGTDTASPGTTCVKVTNPVSASCPSGYVAIQNNNKQLIAAAMQAKATGSRVAFYYEDNGGPFHCPGRTFTPCSVITIELK
jgi:hypothetical protein